MSIKLSPEFCLWCSDARVVDGKCKKCSTKYGNREDRRVKFRPDILQQIPRTDMKRIRKLRFSWEM